MSSQTYRVIKQFRRTVSAVPAFKQLVEVHSVHDEPLAFGTERGALCPDVLFHLLVNKTGQRFWAKQWLGQRKNLFEPAVQIESFLATLDRSDCCLAVDTNEDFGLIYPFDQALFCSTEIIHQWDCRKYFTGTQCAAIEQLAHTQVRWPGLPVVHLGTLTDFQITQTTRGLVFLDFEPNVRYAAELANVEIPMG